MKSKTPKFKQDDELIKRSEAMFEAMTITFGITKQRLLSSSRLKAIVEARGAIVYTLVKAGFCYSEIGRLFKKNHSTIIYTYRKIHNLLTYEEYDCRKLRTLLKFLREVNHNVTREILSHGTQNPAESVKCEVKNRSNEKRQ